MNIDVIIVNWNSGKLLVDAISSVALYHHNLVGTLVIVDNASTDTSLEQVEKLTDLPFPLQVIRNTENKGFGAACNQGAEVSNSDYILFLNPDTQLFDNSLTVPFIFMQKDENRNVGITSIQLLDENGNITYSCSRFPSLKIFSAQAFGINVLPGYRQLKQSIIDWDYESDRNVDQVIGAFFFIRRALFEGVGGFDERFFVYFEEVDLSLRVSQAGYQSVFLSGAKAFHLGGGSSRNVKAHRLFYSLRSRLLYGFKHFSIGEAWGVVVVTLLVEPFSRAAISMYRGGYRDLQNTLKAYFMLYREIPTIFQKN